jgi:D-glycerate 3-kinase
MSLEAVNSISEFAPLFAAWQQFCLNGDAAALRDHLRSDFPPDRHWISPDFDRAAAFERRWQWLQLALPQLHNFFAAQQFSDHWFVPLWSVWLPLACQLQNWYQAEQASHPSAPQIIGFLGGQGSGKTTLTTLLKCLLELQGYRVVAWSLDDLYLPYPDRLALQAQDPRLIWRGPPGTHDLALGLQVLRQFKRGQATVAVPRFDKSCHAGAGDRAGFETLTPVDFVLFEGWCVGAQPVDPSLFEQADLPAPIETDADRRFARDMNQALGAYVPLWERLDRLIVMQLQDYRWSQQWRQQAEQQMRAQGSSGMSDAAIQAFVEYFWKALHPEIFITPLTQDSERVDLVLEIGADHLPTRVYRPRVAQ